MRKKHVFFFLNTNVFFRIASLITAKGMFMDVTMWVIYIRFFSSRGYSFMFTNSAYEMSMGFSNIRGLTLSS